MSNVKPIDSFRNSFYMESKQKILLLPDFSMKTPAIGIGLF